MNMIEIDRDNEVPIFRQIMDQIISLTDRGFLKPGTKLFSTREMADQLDVNRSTVYRAYQELWALGYIESKPGSYSYIRKRGEMVTLDTDPNVPKIDWAGRAVPSRGVLSRPAGPRIRKAAGNETTSHIDFSPLTPDRRLFPIDDFRKCLNSVLRRKGRLLLEYGDPFGYGPLREYIAERLQQHGVVVKSDEILLTSGSQNAIELLLKFLVKPGSSVVVESPTYSAAIPLFRYYQAELTGIGMKEDGMDLAALKEVVKTESPAMIYTMPNFHNPTGITTSQIHREILLSICEKYRIPLVEDGFEEEMKYFGKAALPIKSMDRHRVVIYLGTFSKILFPGLRIGWVAADRDCIEQLAALKFMGDLGGNNVDQAALNLFCRMGHYDLHVKRMHRIFRKRMYTALKCVKKYFPPDSASWTRPIGGYTIWVMLSESPLNPEALADYFEDFGVRIRPGNSHFHESTDNCFFRLSISRLSEPEIEEGMRRIGRGIKKLRG